MVLCMILLGQGNLIQGDKINSGIFILWDLLYSLNWPINLIVLRVLLFLIEFRKSIFETYFFKHCLFITTHTFTIPQQSFYQAKSCNYKTSSEKINRTISNIIKDLVEFELAIIHCVWCWEKMVHVIQWKNWHYNNNIMSIHKNCKFSFVNRYNKKNLLEHHCLNWFKV